MPGELGPLGEPDLAAVPDRLLEVVSGDLFVLGHALAGLLLEPAGVALVQHGAARLRDGGVRGVADQQVAEPVPALAGEQRAVGADDVLADERLEDRDRPAVAAPGSQVAAVECLPFDRGPLEHGALVVGEPVQAGRESAWMVGGTVSRFSLSSSSPNAT